MGGKEGEREKKEKKKVVVTKGSFPFPDGE